MKVSIGKYPKDYNKTQKIKVQIDRWDCWNLFTTLAHIIHPALVLFKEQNSGRPCELESFEEWNKILDKMIESFRYMNDPEYDNWTASKEIRDQIQEGFDLFGKYYQHLWN